ncbi:hypothetical protein Q0590_35050 [Rhodocytophaga aerolata]|uniref:Uncharacterized protein n=1 Tax=Rhodocytophaga aerolata TaxID=455078 RepID=A0ABT8RHI5_9BACT|nr:hypothetical protein [Rhodocytophaga aerolata]MDO1451544.1 hypothetical protein [Rhodocytophaga aerolata]
MKILYRSLIYRSIILVLLSVVNLYAQPGLRKIEIIKGFPNHGYRYGDIYLNIKEVAPILKKHEQAYSLLKPAKTNYSLANSLATVGIIGIIYPLGYKLFGYDSKAFWPILGMGIGTFTISIPFRIKANKQGIKAVELYNSILGSNLYEQDLYRVKVGFTNHGIGVILHLHPSPENYR